MLVRKKKEDGIKNQSISDAFSSEDNVQSLRSWIRKIEQSTTSVSSRLSAVEKRLSGKMTESEGAYLATLEGPIETLVLNVKKKSARELARTLDGGLTLLHNQLWRQDQELCCLKEKLVGIDERNTIFTRQLQLVDTTLSQMKTATEEQMEQAGRRDLFKIRLGAMEIPIEFSGIIGGLLAFSVAILVLLDQKAILLSPVFLFCVGVLLISSAMVKMIRHRSRSTLRPFFSMPLPTPSVHITQLPYERKEG